MTAKHLKTREIPKSDYVIYLNRAREFYGDTQTANLGRIISKKHAVSYDGRDFRKSEAVEIAKQVERFFHWGLTQFPSL